MVPPWHQKSSFRFTPSARKQHVLQRKHGQLLRDFNLLNLCEIHAQRVGIPRGADVIQQVSLQPLCADTWYCTFLTCDCEFCFETDTCTYLPGPLHCKRSRPFAVEGRRGRRSQSPRGLYHVNQKWFSMSRGTFGSDKKLVRGTHVQAGLYSLRTSRRQECSPSQKQKLPEQTWRGRARDHPKREESHVCIPETATMAMYVKLALRGCMPLTC